MFYKKICDLCRKRKDMNGANVTTMIRGKTYRWGVSTQLHLVYSCRPESSMSYNKLNIKTIYVFQFYMNNA